MDPKIGINGSLYLTRVPKFHVEIPTANAKPSENTKAKAMNESEEILLIKSNGFLKIKYNVPRSKTKLSIASINISGLDTSHK